MVAVILSQAGYKVQNKYQVNNSAWKRAISYVCCGGKTRSGAK